MAEKSVQAYVGLGSNIGDKTGYLRKAVELLRAIPEITDLTTSSIWQTPPWGTGAQEVYHNAVAGFKTTLPALDLLRKMQAIENQLERRRPYHWAPRTIDLDLLLYGNEVIDHPDLKVPHPYMKERFFVLLPLKEVAPDLVFPDGETLTEALQKLSAKESAEGLFILPDTF